MDSRIIFLALIFGLVSADIVPFKSCPNHEGKCKVTEVRINPCPEAAENKPCALKRGRQVSIEFDFTPEFEAEKVEAKVYWASEIDLPFVGMDTNGCNYTKCPIVSNQKQTYSFPMTISKKFPVNTYDIKWRLTGKEATDECCFITFIKLTK